MQKQQLNIVMVGHVDHGKSTLIGRLIYEMNALPDGKYDQIVKSCEKRGMQFEWAYLMDALQAERAQNITIDITQFWLRTPKRDYVLIDAPGHHEFLRNMFTGAAEGDVGVLLVDAAQGMQEQTRKHAYLLHLLGVSNVIIAINKMDKVGYDEVRFKQVAGECESYLKHVGLNPLNIIPISAYHGDMLKQRGENMGWYEGATLVEALENCSPLEGELLKRGRTPEVETWGEVKTPLRFCVQDVYRFDERRIIAGTIASGSLQVGDEILISPHNYQAQVASIINVDNQNVAQAVAGDAIGITLTQQRFVERGHVISHSDNAPILSNQFYMRLFWLGAENLQHNKTYAIRLHNSTLSAEVKQINYVLDTNDLSQSSNDFVAQNQVAEVLWQVRGLASFDEYHQIAAMGRAVVMAGDRIVDCLLCKIYLICAPLQKLLLHKM
jgi:bifunctional enzyme CysN/CysC